jgi:hypothetical protein
MSDGFVPLARDARTHGETLGLSGAALDLYVAGGAAERHAARVDAAKAAAMAAAHDDDPDVVGLELALDAWALCELERHGIGGRHGVEGGATVRMPWARNLGKGRRQARDGGAWTSAINAAGAELAKYLDAEVRAVEPELAPTHCVLCPLRDETLDRTFLLATLRTVDDEDRVLASAVVYGTTSDHETRLWVRAYAGRMLLGYALPVDKRAANVDPAVRLLDEEDARAWGALFNAIPFVEVRPPDVPWAPAQPSLVDEVLDELGRRGTWPAPELAPEEGRV